MDWLDPKEHLQQLLKDRFAKVENHDDYIDRVTQRKSFHRNGFFDKDGIELLVAHCLQILESLNTYPNQTDLNITRFDASGAAYFIALHKDCGGRHNVVRPEDELIINDNIYECIMQKFREDGIINEYNQFIWK